MAKATKNPFTPTVYSKEIVSFTNTAFYNKALHKHVFHTSKVASSEECYHLCVKNRKECKSYNYLKSSDKSIPTWCELNREQKDDVAPLNFTDRDGSLYYDVIY